MRSSGQGSKAKMSGADSFFIILASKRGANLLRGSVF